NMKNGQDAAYVLIMKSTDQSSSTVASNVLIGADGFLLEPYSVDSLMEITRLADRIKKERSQAREVAAMKFLLGDVSNRIDAIAYLKSLGRDVARHIKKMADASQFIKNLSPESTQIYNDAIVETFQAAQPPKFASEKQYSGPSARIA